MKSDATPPFEPEYPQLRGIEVKGRCSLGRRSEWLRAEQVMLDRVVAIKRLRPELAADGFIRDRFFEAAREAADIVHPSALSIYNVISRQDCIVMEWCPGKTLREQSGFITLIAAAGIGAAILDSLASLHATGRCHGNLSPGNVFLGANNRVRIADFFQPALTYEGEPLFLDDRRYIAPELRDGKYPDWRSDVYSIGAMLLEVVDPAAVSGKFGDLLQRLHDPDPANRGALPNDILQTLLRIKRGEEIRQGANDGSRMRGQRQYRRIPAELSVNVQMRSATPTETAAILSRIQDIGENGVFVATPDPLGIGTIVELSFTLPGQEDRIHAFGMVRWKSEPPMASGMGVQFVEVEESGIEKVRKYLRRKPGWS